MKSQLGHFLAVAVVINLLLAKDASAYLDPGTGSMIFQAIVAVIAGAAFGIKVYWRRLKTFFGGRTAEAVSSQDEGESSDDDQHGA